MTAGMVEHTDAAIEALEDVTWHALRPGARQAR